MGPVVLCMRRKECHGTCSILCLGSKECHGACVVLRMRGVGEVARQTLYCCCGQWSSYKFPHKSSYVKANGPSTDNPPTWSRRHTMGGDRPANWGSTQSSLTQEAAGEDIHVG